MKNKLLILALWLSFAGPVFSQGRDPAAEFTRTNPKFLAAFKGAIARPSVSTVRVLAGGKEIALGVVVGPDGWILTKAYDLQGLITVRFRSGKSYDADIVGIHTPHDLALLKIDARGLVPIEFKESKVADVGSWVACVGLNDEPVAVGVISVATRNIINKGMAADPNKMPYLGIQIAIAPVDGGGVKIDQVVPGAPAAKSGLQANDVILSVAGAKVDTDNFLTVLGKNKPGDTIALKIRRGKEELDQSAKLEKRPVGSARGDLQNKMGSDLSSRRSGYGTILQHDSVVKPADCGGPIVDLDGRVLGINICRAGRVESWAVPSEVIQPILLELMSGKLAPATSELNGSKLSPDEKLAQAQTAVLKAERDKSRFEKEIEEARRALQSAQSEVKTFRQKDSTESAERVLNLMNKRLLVMNEVAAWKWAHRQEILDADREKEALTKLQLRAKELGVDPKVVERFFKAQVEAGRLLQQDLIANWTKENVQPAAKGDLKKDLRPRIDQLNDELLDSLGHLLRYWKDNELNMPLRIRDRAARALAGQGISDAVRNKSLEGLLAP